MSYTYTDFTLESIDPSGANIRPVKSYIPAPPVSRTDLSVGEKMRMEVEVTIGVGKFKTGQQFCFNLKLFAAPNEIHDFAPKGFGWHIKLKQGASTIDTAWSLQFATNTLETLHQNLTINSVTLDGTEKILTIQMDWFVTQDLAGWIGLQPITNEQRFLQNQYLSTQELDNSTDSAFKREESYIEVAFFECDNNLQPHTLLSPTVQDPIARLAASPQYETFTALVGLKWYDQIAGAQNDWASTTAKTDNWLKAVSVTAGNYTSPITQVAHRGYPYDYENTLRNFIYNQGNSTTQLVVNATGDTTAQKNNVQIKIGSPNLASYVSLVVQVIRAGESNDSVNFVDSYQLAAANVPKLFAGVSVLDGPIETPSAWSVAAGELTLDFILNGEKLEAGADYHVVVLLYKSDAGDDFSSSHITPSLSVTLANINVPTATSSITTYNNTFGNTINDVSIASFERVKLGVVLDGNAYGSSFTDDLQQVRLQQTILGWPPANVSSKKFPAGAGIGQPEIIITDLGGGFWQFEAEFRGYYAATVVRQSFHEWQFEFTPTGFNQPDSVIFKLEQRLRHRPEDTTRLPNIRFLEYSVFPGILNEKTYFCSNLEEFLVVEVEKNGLPNANLLAMISNGPPIEVPPGLFANVDEEESYVGNLPQSFSPYIEQVDTSFTTQLDPNKAYFVANLAYLTLNKYFNALIYDI